MAVKPKKTIDSTTTEPNERIKLKTIYTFVFGRNVYTVRMRDIKKVTLLGHNFIDDSEGKNEVTKTLYIFSVVGDQIQGHSEEDANGHNRPMYETIMEVKAEEDDYSALYNIYEDLIIKWDEYQQSVISTNVSLG
jgi:hypothetical protein